MALSIQGLVPLLVALPLLTAFVVVLLAHIPLRSREGKADAYHMTYAPALAAVAANLAIAVFLLTTARVSVFVGGWGGVGKTLGIEMVCDGFAKLMAVIINGVALAALLFAGPYMKRFTKLWLFQALLLLMVAAMNGVVLAGDLFNLFVFLEVAAIASYALVGFGCESEELEAAFKYLILGTVGAAFVLLGVTLLYSLTGHLNMEKVSQALRAQPAGPALSLAAAALLGGLALKAAMVPFHAWLPDAHPSAPAPISAMLSGVLIKASGVYALTRVVFNVLPPSSSWGTILIVLGVASMVIGGLLAAAQWDLKRLLAYSSISQMGYVVLAVGVAAEVMAPGHSQDRTIAALCLFGGLFHLFNHAAFKSLLFLSAGSIEHQTGTRMLKEMGGLARRMRTTSFCCRVGALSIAGVPPFNGFFSKLIIIIALAMAGHPALAAVAAGVAVVTLVYFVKVQRYALEGEPAERVAAAREAPALMRVGLVVLAVVCIVAGVAMAPLWTYLFEPAGEALLSGVAAPIAGGLP